ncbi:MAG: hypothetical protein GY946_03635 [bacterium]|nr:hypothetical protein [bacterium]
MKSIKWMIAVGLALAIAQSSAATTFTFTGLGSVPGGGYADTQGGITVTVTAPGESLGYLTLDGIGVYTGGINLAALQDNETLLISFSQSVTVDDLHMRQWEDADEIDITGTPGGFISYGPDSNWLNTNEHLDLTSLGAVTSFTITGDSFLTATLLAGLSVTAVPEPSVAMMFIAGVLGLVRFGTNRAI